MNFAGNGKKSMHVSVEASLKKLQTSYIDILYVHWCMLGGKGGGREERGERRIGEGRGEERGGEKRKGRAEGERGGMT